MPAGMRPVPISTRARLPRGRTCSLAMGVWAPGRGPPVEGLRDTLFCGLQSAGKPGPHSPRGRSQCPTRLPPGPCFPTPGPSEPAVDRSQPPEASWLTGAPAPPRSQRAPRLPTGLGTGHPDVVPWLRGSLQTATGASLGDFSTYSLVLFFLINQFLTDQIPLSFQTGLHSPDPTCLSPRWTRRDRCRPRPERNPSPVSGSGVRPLARCLPAPAPMIN